MTSLNVLMSQMNTLVGDFEGNTDKILATLDRAAATHERCVVVFPELTISGYPPEDLLLRPSLQLRVDEALARICAAIRQASMQC